MFLTTIVELSAANDGGTVERRPNASPNRPFGRETTRNDTEIRETVATGYYPSRV